MAADPPRRVPMNANENLVFGALGGILETCIHMPLVTFKICTQESRPFPPTIAGWYRGVFANAASLAPITAVQVSSNGVLTKLVTGGTRETTSSEKMLTASGAGIISALLYSPVDLVVIQQQKLKMGPWGAIKHISNTYGPQMLMRGFGACAIREAVYTAGYLGIAPVCKGAMQEQSEYWKEHDLSASIVSSCIGGTIAAQLTHPVDTAKTCLQADLVGEKYQRLPKTIKELYDQGGIRSLYKGGSARTLRLCGAFFVINNVIEFATQYKSKEGSLPFPFSMLS